MKSYQIHKGDNGIVFIRSDAGRVSNPVDDPGGSFGNPFRYAGYVYDDIVKLYNLNARFYDPESARFTQPDPYWHPGNMIYGDKPYTMAHGIMTPDIYAIGQSTNLYVYCGGNPLRFVDTSGLRPDDEDEYQRQVMREIRVREKAQYEAAKAKLDQKRAKEILIKLNNDRNVSQSDRDWFAKYVGGKSIDISKFYNINVEQYKKDFVVEIYNKAVYIEIMTGIPAAIITAQACTESTYGTEIPTDIITGLFSYNLFGVKGTGNAGRVLDCTHENINGQKVRVQDYFAAYTGYDISLASHADLLDRLYRPTVDTIEGWARSLQNPNDRLSNNPFNYTTNPNYTNIILNVINYWGLY